MSVFVDVEKTLGSFHLKAAFEAENEILALLGASGCGKSMTLRCIAGIVRPDRGRIMLNGRTLFDSEQHIDLPPQQRGVGYLFQQYALFPHMTVEKNVCAGTREGTRTERKAAAQRILRTLGLEELAQRLPANLSGGQQQRVALARTLNQNPTIILADEPVAALDPVTAHQVMADFKRINEEMNITILINIHHVDLALGYAQRVVGIRAGEIVYDGPSSEVTQEILDSIYNGSAVPQAGGN